MSTLNRSNNKLRLGILGVNFGWGSHAALESILREVRNRVDCNCWVIGFGSEYGRNILSEVVDEWCGFDRDDYISLTQAAKSKNLDVALVTLEGFAARSFEDAGVKTVFLDLMPFLWRGNDLSVPPLDVSYYLAMNLPGLKKETLGWMKTIKNLHWIEAVVPKYSVKSENLPRNGDQAIITLGGILGMSMTNTSNYPTLVLPGVLDALTGYGFRRIVVAGNVKQEVLESIAKPYRSCAEFILGPLGRDEYPRRIAESSICLSQPGLMSLLEASSCGTPLIRLPPQNISGFIQAEIHKAGTGAKTDTRWPNDVVNETLAHSKAVNGEASGNEYIYQAIADALMYKADIVRTSIKVQVSKLIPKCLSLPANTWYGLVNSVGTDGARQAAEILIHAVKG
ncbi:hypothetical protein [Photorhabdus temperata]|uniref:Glycosyl transferase family 28 C-terminal domain-containing protein n=1 Tax=Photorhabdus temperata J3 TaxID=1389415 RepID=U7R021_PHOTE|nr:hypothetical protein [Photorhabdus temperata]ERT13679.1 hypothetical protein O185_07560 [Photorhabdus temperata J3]